MANNNHHLIPVDVFNHLISCPPHVVPIPEDQIEEIAEAIVANFDYSLIYDKIDQMACQMMRERGIIEPSIVIVEVNPETDFTG